MSLTLIDAVKAAAQKSSVIVHTLPQTHHHAYEILEHLFLPTLCVTLSQPAAHLLRTLHQKQLPTQHLSFLDTITRSVGADRLPNAHYLPTMDLTKLETAIKEWASRSHRRKLLLFDSLSVLPLYYHENIAVQFYRTLQNHLQSFNMNGIFLHQYLPEVMMNEVKRAAIQVDLTQQ